MIKAGARRCRGRSEFKRIGVEMVVLLKALPATFLQCMFHRGCLCHYVVSLCVVHMLKLSNRVH